jgi:HAMP domain-containing protein
MPGGKRTDHISARDLEVLAFIARFGVVPRGAVVIWAATGRSVTIARETRLRKEGLIRVVRGYGSFGPLALCTRAGLRAAGHPELRTARVSAAALSHETILATTAAAIERGGERLISEREILARERAAGEPIHSATLPNGRAHRADMIRTDEGGMPREAIEVELSVKSAVRLDQLLRAWRHAVLDRKVSGVVYRCAPRVRPYLERAVERTRTGGVIAVRDL